MRRGLLASALSALLLLPLAACKDRDKPPKQEAAPAVPVAPAATATEPIPWRHDDYDGALAAARAAGKPLVIDMWAPWCHTCISMQEYVLSDPGLAELAARFEWVALDTDKRENAAALEKLPVDAWPTFFVVSPVDESVQARHLGAASLEQFREMLRQGEGGHLDAAGKGGALDPTLAAMRSGDRLALQGDFSGAEAAYREALELGGPDWPRRPEVLVALANALENAGNPAACAELVGEHLGAVARTRSASVADFAYAGHSCAASLEADPARKLREMLVAPTSPLMALLSSSDHRLSADDQSDAMRIVREIEDSLGHKDQALEWASKQRALLDAEAAKAPNAFARMTFNWPRAEVYVYLGEAEALIPDLQRSVSDLPDQYDPLYRLAWIYLNTGDYDQAVEAAESSADKAYGPRKANILRLLADVHAARGDKDGERRTRAQVVALYESLPPGQARPDALQSARDQLAALD